jgi:chromate transporter
MQTTTSVPQVNSWKLFRIWSGIGLQSFGGGASTVLLIQNAFINKYHYISIEEFSHLWNLCVFTPGINLVALTVLLGRKLGGIRGIIASLTGMLLPSALITCLLAAGFKLIAGHPTIEAITRGVIPATAGIMLVVGVNFARPLIVRAWKEGVVYLLLSSIFITTCALAIILFNISVIFVLLASAGCGALLFTSWRLPIGDIREEEEKHD